MAKQINTGFIADTVNGIKINTSIHCNPKNYSQQDSRIISFVVLHYTGNRLDSAVNNAKYFRDAATGQASAHYFVDDTNIYQSVALHDSAYHCGAKTYVHPKARNANSVSIELCCTGGNYTISNTTIENGAYLTAFLCQMLDIGAENVDTYVIRHFDVTGKICPKQFVNEPEQWEDFKKAVKSILINGGISNQSSNNFNSSLKEATIPLRALNKGCIGTDVLWLQQSLNIIQNSGLVEDGLFGDLTLTAVKKFQKEHELEIDGSVGPITRGAIINVIYLKNNSTVTKKAITKINNPERYIWDYLYSKIGNAYGVSGLMANLYAESGLKSTNLQNSFEKKLGYTDETYTEAVDNGTYKNFVKDSAGFGICQWTYWTRKQGFLDYANSKNASIGDLPTQLEYLMKELQTSYPKLLAFLKNAKTVKSASDAVLTRFEKPKDQGATVKAKRVSYGQTFYNKYVKSSIKSAIVKQYVVYSQKFLNKTNAETEYNQIRGLGYNCNLYKSGLTYRVQIALCDTYELASNVCDAVIKAGHIATVEAL